MNNQQDLMANRQRRPSYIAVAGQLHHYCRLRFDNQQVVLR